MPSRNRFSIRRLLATPRRPSASVGVGAVDETNYSNRNRSSPGSSSGSSTIGPANNRSSSSLASVSPTEEEMSRIKTAVAAAANAAASNLRLRDDGDMYRPRTNSKATDDDNTIDTNTNELSCPASPSGPDNTTNTEGTISPVSGTPANPISVIDPARIQARQAEGKRPEKLRKKNRASVQPVVAARPTSSDSHSKIPAEPPRLSLSFQHQKRQTIQTIQTFADMQTAHPKDESQTTLDALTTSAGQTLLDTPLDSQPASATSLCSSQNQAQPGVTPQSALAGNRQDSPCSSNGTADQVLPTDLPPTPNPDQLSSPSLPCSSAPSSPCSPHPALMASSLPHPRQLSASHDYSYTSSRSELDRPPRKSLSTSRKRRRQSDGKKDSGVELSDDEPASSNSVDDQRQSTKDLDLRAEPHPDNEAGDQAGDQAMQRPRSAGIGSISLPIQVHNISTTSIDKISTDVSPADGGDMLGPGSSPTFTHPRRAPSPLGLPKLPATGSAAMTPPHTPPASSSTFGSPEPEPIISIAVTPATTGKKQPRLSRFRPASLARKPSNASTRMQRKRSKKSRKRERTMSKASSILPTPPPSNRNSGQKPQRYSISGAARWTLPDNVTELFNGRLFNRIEVTEMLSPEQLQAIRENRPKPLQQSPTLPKKSMESETGSVTKAVTETSAEPPADAVTEPKTQAESQASESKVQDQEATPQQNLDETPEEPQHVPPAPETQSPSTSQRSPSSTVTGDIEGSETPIEPFHLQDLPSRIGAAGVRLSVLLPVEEEAACFAASIRKRSGLTTDAQEPEDKPVLPLKNPLRYTRIKKNMPVIPELLVTDTDVGENDNPTNSQANADPAAAIMSYAERLLPSVEIRKHDADNVYLPASPYSMAMPMYRHGPIRLAKPELPEARAPMLGADDTLDWTAFQMAILGGANDFFSDSVDYGRSSADADELDDLVNWFHSSGIYAGRLIKEGDRSNKKKRSSNSNSRTSRRPRQPKQQPAEMEGSYWYQPDSAPIPASGNTNDAWKQAAPTQDQQFYADTHDTGIQRLSFNSPQQQYTGDSSPYRNRSAQSSSSSVYSRGGIGSEVNSSTSTLPPLCIAEMPATMTPPPLDPSKFQSRKSCASFDSFESMPQSPMQDVMMSQRVDGMDYAVPMGYNLSHDLGDFLRWESQNVCGGDF